MEDGELKQKSDFITNSSSASYIMTIKSDVSSMSLERFRSLLNDYMEIYKRENPGKIRFWDASDIEKIDENMFTVSAWTSMHNWNTDIPGWMRELMLQHFIKDHELGFTVEKFKIDQDY